MAKLLYVDDHVYILAFACTYVKCLLQFIELDNLFERNKFAPAGANNKF